VLPIFPDIIVIAESTWVLGPEGLIHEVVTCLSLSARPIT
jgi:hypothetical protein